LRRRETEGVWNLITGRGTMRSRFLLAWMWWVTALVGPGEAGVAGPDREGFCGEGDRQSIHAFARYLFEEGYWNEAAEEFLRFCFVCPEDPRVPGARLFVGVCWERAGRHPEAVAAYRALAEDVPASPEGMEARVRIGERCYREGRYEEARVELRRFLDRDPPEPWNGRARYRVAWASLKLHAFVAARGEFSGLAMQPGLYRSPSEEILSVLDRIPRLPYRSPVLAGVLSALVPGAGQLYAGETKDALLSFLVNGALIAATYEAFDKQVYGVGGVACVVAAGFYAGNLYGAVNSAHHANRDRLTGALNLVGKQYEWVESPPGVEEAALPRAFLLSFPFPRTGGEPPRRAILGTRVPVDGMPPLEADR